MKIQERFWNTIAKSYSKRPIADQAAYHKKLGKTCEYLTPQFEVFGCGTGSTAIAHARYVKNIFAIDVSSNMIDIAIDKAKDNHVDIEHL